MTNTATPVLRLGDKVRVKIDNVFAGEAVVDSFPVIDGRQQVRVVNSRYGFINCEFSEVTRG